MLEDAIDDKKQQLSGGTLLGPYDETTRSLWNSNKIREELSFPNPRLYPVYLVTH